MLGFMIAGLDTRPSITDLCDEFPIQPKYLAILADVSEETIQNMLLHEPVCKEDAEKVLDELSWLLDDELSFENVYVPLIKVEHHETDITEH